MAAEDLIARFEGYRPEPYWDHNQWSVGYGSYAGSRDPNSPPNITVTEPEARAMLAQQLPSYRRNVEMWNQRGNYGWDQQQIDALTSFAYNIGSIDQLTANGTRTNAEIAEAMSLYVNASGQPEPGLINRRAVEQAVFTGNMSAAEASAGGAAGAIASGVGSNTTTGSGGALPLHANPKTMQNLAAIRENNDWIPNPLNEYENYTYNIELFLVSPADTINFFENTSIKDISSGAWPSAGTKKVIIAQTGVTTEFNIDGLRVTTAAAGSSPEIISGSSTRMSFTLTQVGEVTLADSIRSATLLAGWQSIGTTTFFVKVTFKGYDVNGRPFEIPNTTKVLPFRLTKLSDLTTEVDVSGTYLVLEGMVLRSSGLRSDIDTFPDNIEFTLGSTLRETVENLKNAVNDYIRRSAYSDDDKFLITYDIQPIDSSFESSFYNDNIMTYEGTPNFNLGNNTRAGQNPGARVGSSERIGILPTGASVYDLIRDLMLQTTTFRALLTSESNSYTDIPSVKVQYVPKVGGYNPVTNSEGATVTYFLSTVKEMIDQNSVDMARKITNNGTVIQDLQNQGRLKKIYEHMYTGLNTEVLNFRVSLERQLIKAFNSPSDEFIDFTNLAEYTITLDQLNENAMERLGRLRDEFTQASSNIESSTYDLSTMQHRLNTSTTSLNDALSNAQTELAERAGLTPERAQEIVNMPFSELIAAAGQSTADETGLDETSIIADVLQRNNIVSRINNYNSFYNAVSGLESSISGFADQVDASLSEVQQILATGQGISLANRFQSLVGDIGTNLTTMGVSGDFALLEELDNDIRQRLSVDQLGALFSAMTANPVTFRRAAEVWMRNETSLRGTSDGGDPSNGVLSRLKYNEGHQGDLSMVRADMTIKGDPFWIENYASDKSLRELLGENNFYSSLPNDSTRNIGRNYAMIVENVLSEPDENDNSSIDNLFTWVYQVNMVESVFESGLFTQELKMIKHVAIEGYDSEPDTAGTTGVGSTGGDGTGDGGEIGNADVDGSGEGAGVGNSIGVGELETGLGSGNGATASEITGPGRGTMSPSRTATNGYALSRDGIMDHIGEFIQGLAGAGFPDSQTSNDFVNAYNEMRMAATYGSSTARSDLAFVDEWVKSNLVAQTAEEFAQFVDDHPEVYDQLTPALVGALSQVYGGENIMDYVSDPSAIDVSDVMTEIGDLDQRITMPVDQMIGNPDIVVRSLPDPELNARPVTGLNTAYANSILSDNIPAVDTSVYPSPTRRAEIMAEQYSQGRRDFQDTVLAAERAYVTTSEAIILSRIEQEQLSLLEQTQGSFTAMTPTQQAYYDELTQLATEARTLAAQDPARMIAQERDMSQYLEERIDHYESQVAIDFDWTPNDREDRLDDIDETFKDIAETNSVIGSHIAGSVVTIPNDNGQIEIREYDITPKPTMPTTITTVVTSSPISEIAELTQQQLDDYAAANAEFNRIYNSEHPRVSVNTILLDTDGVTVIDEYVITVPILPEDIRIKYGLGLPQEGDEYVMGMSGSYTLSDTYDIETGGIRERVMRQIVSEYETLGVSSGYMFTEDQLLKAIEESGRGGPLTLEVGRESIVIVNEEPTE